MRLLRAIAGASVLLASVAAIAGVDHEADLQKMLGNRVQSGPPVRCIYQHDITGSHIVDGTAILYDMAGGDIYVNRPASGASMLDRNQYLVTDNNLPQLCNVDMVSLVDATTHIPVGNVGLGDFVPYSKHKR